MKRLILIFFVLFVFILFTGCKPKTIDRVVAKEIPYNINKIIKQIQLEDDKLLVFYTLNAEVEHGNKIRKLEDILNVAILRRNSEEEWEFLGDRDWSDYIDEDMEVYDDTVFYEENGETKNIAVIYGRIYNRDIVNVEIGNEETKYVKAKIFEEDGIRYFYKVYKLSDLQWEQKENSNERQAASIGAKGFLAKGISKDGKIIVIQRGE